MSSPRSSHPRRSTGRRLLPAAAVALVLVAGCGEDAPRPLEGSLSGAQILGLDRAWSQRITALSASTDAAGKEATALYRACATMNQGSTFLQAVHATCAPTAVSVKLRAVIPERCATASRQCIRALDRAKAANDTLLGTLMQLSDTVKTATEDVDCRAEFTTDAARQEQYRALSSAYDALALGIERSDPDIAKLGRQRIQEADAALRSRLTVAEQVARFRQACGIQDDA